MNGKVTYHQQVSFCGKPRCRKCREGIGHGPYWYAYHTVGGRTTRTYVGKHLPPGAETAMEPPPMNIMDNADMDDMPGVPSVPGVQGLPGMVPASLPDNAILRISTLGQFRLERRVDAQWQTVTDVGWQLPETRALLGYLLSCPERAANGAQVVHILWPGVDAATTRLNVKRAIHDLRLVLGMVEDRSDDSTGELAEIEPNISSHPSLTRRRPTRRISRSVRYFLHVEDDRLMLADQSLLWVDADAFEHVVTQLRTAPAHTGEDGQSLSALYEEAVALYGGEYLPEEREAAWAVLRRQTLRRNWIGLLLDLADLRLQRGATSGAIDILDRLLAADPANEAAVQRLIVVLARLKRRGEALRAYHRLTEVLQREYQAEPSEETRAIFEAARRGEEISLTPDRLRELASTELSKSVEAGERTRGERTERKGDEDDLDDSGSLVTEFPSPLSPVPLVPSGQPTPIGRTHQSPLVGREHELEVLQNVLLEVEQSARTQLVALRRSTGMPLHTQRRPQTVFLMGEAGIGKTRLAEEMSRQAQRRGWTVMWSRVYAQESGIPYRLWTEALRKAMSQSAWHWQEVGKRPTIYQPLTTLLPELGSMLPRKTSLLAPEQEQLRLWEATRTLFMTLSESTPLLIVLDDIQWADKSSCDLLAHLGRNVQGYPILLLCTCRENEIVAHPLYDIIAHMQREHTVMTLSVDPLTSEQIARLVSHLPEPMVQHIKDQAAGNPFFAEELARTSPPTLPRTIAAALDSRMSRLSAACQQLLGNAAVLGGAFDLPIIYAMETREAGGLLTDEDTVLDLLDEAQKAGVLAEEGTGTRITYHFWHPLLVSHLYERVSAARRLRLHQRAAAILQRIYQKREEEVAATITHHLVRGGAAPLAIAHYAELAGERAYALSAYPEAERHYRLAVNQLESVGTASTLSENTSSDGEQLEMHDQYTLLPYLLERLAECTVILGNFAEARSFYERLLEMHRHLPVAANEAERQEEAQVQALLWCEIGRTWRFSQLERTRTCLERGEEVLRAAGILGGPAWARLRYQQSALYLQEGRYNEGHHAAQEALTLFEQQQRKAATLTSETPSSTKMTLIRRILEGDPSDLGRTHNLLGRLANAVGWRTQALSHFSIALALYEQYDYKREISIVLCNMGYIHLKRGEYELAQAMLRRALNLALRIGDDPQASVIYSDLGELADASGDLDEAESQYRRALELADRFDDREYRSRWNAALAEVLCRQGKYSEAGPCIIRALSIGRAMRSIPCTGIALVALGKLRIAQASEPEKLPSVRTRLLAHAREDLLRALALEGLEAETRTRGQLVLAQLLLLLGNVDQARTTVLNVIEESHRHELALVEESAKRLLEQM